MVENRTARQSRANRDRRSGFDSRNSCAEETEFIEIAEKGFLRLRRDTDRTVWPGVVKWRGNASAPATPPRREISAISINSASSAHKNGTGPRGDAPPVGPAPPIVIQGPRNRVTQEPVISTTDSVSGYWFYGLFSV